ncbi:MAG: energy transducer TonB [Saprospiraceae bacterium]|nr:energy transducer TonB [Candidatus Opimibacter iunctus]
MDQEQTYKWIQERLRQLNSGTLSEADRLRLVEIAREDPFVADALEGFDAHPDIAHAQHLDALAKKIKPAPRLRRRWLIPNLTVTAVAASVLLIVATYMVITRIEKPADESVLVMIAPDTLTQDSMNGAVAMEPDTKVSSAADEKIYATEGTVEKERADKPVHTATKETTPPASADATTAAKKPAVIAADAEVESSPVIAAPAAPPVADDQPVADEDIAAESKVELSRAKRDEGYYANQMDASLMMSRVTGHVVDAQNGEPIAKAKLLVSYSNQVFYPDILGNFELYLPEPEAVIQAASEGYTESNKVIHQGEENILVSLEPGTIAPPLNVAGSVAKGPITPSRNPAIESFLNIHQYITTSSTFELTTEPTAARRKVTVEFKVGRDGNPKNITVVESSRDKNYDGEAVRLIESGPDWVCPGGEYPCVRRYTFYFR